MDHKTRGLSGFTNFGTTCYMNSALQSLCMTKPLIAYFLHPNTTFFNQLENHVVEQFRKKSFEPDTQTIKEKTKMHFLYLFRQIMRIYWKYNCEIKPKTFKQYINKNMNFFSGNSEQHDSQEFLTALLDIFHETLKTSCNNLKSNNDLTELLDLDKHIENEMKNKNHNSVKALIDAKQTIYNSDKKKYIDNYATNAWNILLKKSYSIINDIFSGMSLTTIKCDSCLHEYHRFERFDMLSLYIPSDDNIHEYTLDELINFYSKEEKMENNNKYFCAYCNSKQNATKKMSIYQLPQTLVFMIKKYKHNGTKIVKNMAKINYSHAIDMNNHVLFPKNETQQYNLYSVIRHIGGIGSGHYYTYNKNHLNNLWYMHDDEDVYNVKDSDPIDANGYILFYQKQ